MKKRLFITVFLGLGMAGVFAMSQIRAQENTIPTPGLTATRQKTAPSKGASQPKFYKLKDDSKKPPVRKDKFYPLNAGTPPPATGPGLIHNKAGQPVTAWAPGKKKSYNTLYQDSPK